MRRRQFIALAGGAAASGLLARSACAQDRPWISLLHSGFPKLTPIDQLFDALRALGYENGRTARIDLLGAEGDPHRLEALIARLSIERPDLIIALTSPAVLGLKRAGVTTPVVFLFVSDPVALGVVDSLTHPGANFTGLTYSDARLGGKRLELLADALPGMKRVAVIWTQSFLENAALLEAVRASASARRIEIFTRKLEGPEDLPRAFEDVRLNGAQAVVFITDNLLFGYRKEVAEQALANRLPSMHSYPPEARDGGFMSFGPDLGESYRRAAALADKILTGARPADIPVEEPTRFTLVVNMNTAKALGLTVPQSLLAHADEVIE
jgi:putative ABC transport system substrate-binding protein